MIGELYKKDLRRLTKQPAGFLFLIALPLVLASLMNIIFSNNNDSGVLPRIKLIVEDHDDSFVSNVLKGAFNRGELGKMFDVQEVEKDAGRAYVEEDKVAALLIIPQGFADSLLAVSKTELYLIKNPSLDFGPKITEEVVHIFAEGADRLVRIGEKPIRLIRNEMTNDNRMTDQATATIAVMINQLFNKSGDLIFNPPISLKKSSVSGDATSSSDSKIMFTLLLTGIATMCIFFILNGLAVDYFREREQFTLYRILISPTPSWNYVLSKQLYLFTAGFISLLAVWIPAFTIFGVTLKFSQSMPFLFMLIFIAASTTGIISLLYTIIRTRGQASAILPAVIILFALLGGGMIPIQALPTFFRHLSIFSPIYWGVDALQKVLIDNSGFSGIFIHLSILAGLSVFCLTTTILFQRRRIRL